MADSNGIASIELTLTPSTIMVGKTSQASFVITRGDDGTTNEFTGTGPTYTSSNTSVATIDTNGVITALAVGTTTITVNGTSGNTDDVTSATATLTVVTNAKTTVSGKVLKDAEGNEFSPVTSSDTIFFEDGSTLEETLGDIVTLMSQL